MPPQTCIDLSPVSITHFREKRLSSHHTKCCGTFQIPGCSWAPAFRPPLPRGTPLKRSSKWRGAHSQYRSTILALAPRVGPAFPPGTPHHHPALSPQAADHRGRHRSALPARIRMRHIRLGGTKEEQGGIMKTEALPGPWLQSKERLTRTSRGRQHQHLSHKILASWVKTSPECLPSANTSFSFLGKTFYLQKATCELYRVSPCL